ncbi:MAG: serine/threonine-protein phosphatase [Myxococcales bacterium]|nr:serine/threonine-protein phosphatase [Myxococcales bacterium]
MRRLLEDFDAIFDLRYRVGGAPLGKLVKEALAEMSRPPLTEWGSKGPREAVSTESERHVSFFYRPHLFPKMELNLRLAHELQFELLPRELPPGAPVSIASVLESYCHLSGDLFGWELLSDGTFLIWIVDMSGHGVRAGLTSAVLKLLLGQLRERSRIDELMTSLNRELSGSLKPEHRNIFATAFFLTLSPDGTGVYGSAGHPPMLVRRRSGDIEELESIDRPLGLFDDTEYESRQLHFGTGDTLLLYTDGLVEAEGHDGEFFGLTRLRRLLELEHGAPEQLTAAIYREITARQDIDKLEDDVTFLAAKIP